MKADARSENRTYEEFRKLVLELLAKELRVPRDQLRPEKRLREDLGADSLDMIEIALKLEDDLGVVLDFDEAAKLVTLGDAMTLAETRWRVDGPRARG